MMELSIEWTTPRWASKEQFVEGLAAKLGLDCEVSITKGWIFERGRVTVRGPVARCNEFRRQVYASLDQYGEEG